MAVGRVVARAKERGEVRADVDADTVLLSLVSPLLVIPLIFRRRPTRSEVQRIADFAFASSAREVPS